MVKQPTHDFLIENAQYKAIIKENQLQVAELRETIRNMKLQTERLNARLLATETELDRQRDINCMYYQLRRPEKETKLPGQQMIKAYPQGMRGGRLSRPFNALGKEERDSIIDMFGRVEGMHVVTTPDKLIGKGTGFRVPFYGMRMFLSPSCSHCLAVSSLLYSPIFCSAVNLNSSLNRNVFHFLDTISATQFTR